MDERRMDRLQVLAGLRLGPEEKMGLLQDLVALEALVAQLPALSLDGPVRRDGNPDRGEPEAAPLDRQQVQDNAPAMEDGFFTMPGPGRETAEP